MSPTKSGQKLQFTLRLDPDTAARVERLAEQLSRPGFPAGTTDVLRMAVVHGLPLIEADAKRRK